MTPLFAAVLDAACYGNEAQLTLIIYASNRQYRSPFHGSWKVTKPLHETEAKVELAQLEKWK